ncbi:hypothetical protein P9139_12430 [Curtobacterium flaccumfaciens]|nr:hypothetical protein P9139_12430 [Curtobacterium flaccumfaciens]
MSAAPGEAADLGAFEQPTAALRDPGLAGGLGGADARADRAGVVGTVMLGAVMTGGAVRVDDVGDGGVVVAAGGGVAVDLVRGRAPSGPCAPALRGAVSVAGRAASASRWSSSGVYSRRRSATEENPAPKRRPAAPARVPTRSRADGAAGAAEVEASASSTGSCGAEAGRASRPSDDPARDGRRGISGARRCRGVGASSADASG